MTKQTTISKAVSLSGVGIHTGKKVKLTFVPFSEKKLKLPLFHFLSAKILLK